MRVFASYSIKGGVGKTATAVSCAYLSAAAGAPTLLWDLDPQGAATFTFRIRPKVKGGARGVTRDDGTLERAIRGSDYRALDLVPADFSFRNLDLYFGESARPEEQLTRILGRFEGEYEQVFFDCAPSASIVSQNVFEATDVLMIPTIPTPLSRALAQLLRHLKKREGRRPLLLPFFCMLDRRKKVHRDVVTYAREQELGFLDTMIPYASAVEQMALRRAPLPTFAPRDPATLAYQMLWNEVQRRVAGEAPRGKTSPKRLDAALELVRRGRPAVGSENQPVRQHGASRAGEGGRAALHERS